MPKYGVMRHNGSRIRMVLRLKRTSLSLNRVFLHLVLPENAPLNLIETFIQIGVKWSQSNPSIPDGYLAMAAKRAADTDIEGETSPVRVENLSARPARVIATTC